MTGAFPLSLFLQLLTQAHRTDRVCSRGLCRGIDVVRNKIKMFAQKKTTLPPGRHKIVILDEADRCLPLFTHSVGLSKACCSIPAPLRIQSCLSSPCMHWSPLKAPVTCPDLRRLARPFSCAGHTSGLL